MVGEQGDIVFARIVLREDQRLGGKARRVEAKALRPNVGEAITAQLYTRHKVEVVLLCKYVVEEELIFPVVLEEAIVPVLNNAPVRQDRLLFVDLGGLELAGVEGVLVPKLLRGIIIKL